jgi:hypothetical protein
MLLTRIWFLLLAVAAILGLSTALLARGMFNRDEVSDVDEHLRRDRFGAELLLKLDARASTRSRRSQPTATSVKACAARRRRRSRIGCAA